MSFVEIIPILAFFTMCALRLMPAVNVITASLPTLRTSYTSLGFVVKDLRDSSDSAVKINNNSSSLDFNVKKGKKIIFDNVDFAYKSSQKIFDKTSFSVSIGDTVAFMGDSGTGKSTLMDLLMGLQNLEHGIIKYDNINIFDDIRKWQRNFGYIPQNVNLIDETIRNNIAFGINEKDINVDQIQNCVKLSQLEKLIQD